MASGRDRRMVERILVTYAPATKYGVLAWFLRAASPQPFGFGKEAICIRTHTH
jgi:hypothetical protein